MPVALVDVDGTLVDSNDAHARAWVEAFAEEGIDVPFTRVRPLIGMGGDKLVPEVTGRDDEAWAKRVGERRTAIFLERHAADVRALPHARALVARLREAGLGVVVATSANEDEYERLIGIAGVRDLLDEETTKDDAERSKPDPDIVGAALARGGAAPHEALMLGDTPYDVEAARRAGVGCVAVRSGGWDDAALAGAVATYADVAALLAAWDDSPFARLARTGRADAPPALGGGRAA